MCPEPIVIAIGRKLCARGCGLQIDTHVPFVKQSQSFTARLQKASRISWLLSRKWAINHLFDKQNVTNNRHQFDRTSAGWITWFFFTRFPNIPIQNDESESIHMTSIKHRTFPNIPFDATSWHIGMLLGLSPVKLVILGNWTRWRLYLTCTIKLPFFNTGSRESVYVEKKTVILVRHEGVHT